MRYYMPHGACWFWDWRLVFIHSIGDALTFLAYMIIPAILIYVYKMGRLQRLAEAYPIMWRWGAAFIFFCGLSHLGSFLEIWLGGGIYWITGANKIIMAIVSLRFARQLWVIRREIVILGRILAIEAERIRPSI